MDPADLTPTEPQEDLAEQFVEHIRADMEADGSYRGLFGTPPIEVYRGPTGAIEVVDGHHRLEAARRANLPVEVIDAPLEKLKTWLRLKGRLSELP